MTGNRISEAMMTEIVAALVWIGARLPGVNKRQAQHVVGGFVPSIFAVVKNRRAKLAASVGHVRPLLGRHFVMIGSIVATLDSTEAQIVSSLRVRCRKGKRCLEQTIRRLPINQVLNLDAIAALRQPHALHESRAAAARVISMATRTGPRSTTLIVGAVTNSRGGDF